MENQQEPKQDWLHRLKTKWKVNSIAQVIIILCTFAIGGSMCGFLGKKLMPHFGIENDVLWGVVYFLVITILWPICVIIVSLPMGQYKFFKNYLSKMGKRISGR